MNRTNAILIRVMGLVMALFWIVLLQYALPIHEIVTDGSESLGFSWHQFLIDSENDMYPVNIQVLMWISFFMCIAEVFVKWFAVKDEREEINQFSLYSNPTFVTINYEGENHQINLDPNEAMKPELLSAIYSAKRDHIRQGSLIADLFKKINFQFHSTNDVGDVYSAVTTSIDLDLHRVDLRYTVLKYLAWLIPTLGFIGTVIGIAVALGKAGEMGSADPQLLAEVIPRLASAFYTTLLALLLSAVVMILIQLVQAQDEETVSDVGRFCLDEIVVNLKPRN
jgi:biopolymer transport protein ExbB/TolQ